MIQYQLVTSVGRMDLVDGRGDELAAEDDVREQDGEIAAGLGVPVLLVEHVPRDGHQVRLLRLRRVVHLAPLRRRGTPSSLASFARAMKAVQCRARGHQPLPRKPVFLARPSTGIPLLQVGQCGEEVRLGAKGRGARRGRSLVYLSDAVGCVGRALCGCGGAVARGKAVGTVRESEALSRGGARRRNGGIEGANTGRLIRTW
jgi:hypothetical protein